MPPKKSGAPVSGGNTLDRKRKTDAARTIRVEAPPALPTDSINGLPAIVDVERFAQARSFEIGAMQSAMKSATEAASHRVWQTLPRHLRRRAASHDVRRVPVRLRDKAKLETQAGSHFQIYRLKIDLVKRKTFMKLLKRKRRLARDSGRTQKFRNRQKNKAWLETHLWHAKRMHMLDIWGYRLAMRPTEKSFRPSHRAAIHGSTINDVSYTATLELSGEQEALVSLLKQCCEPSGVGPWAARYMSGARVCRTVIYEAGMWPAALIAPITIIWRPLIDIRRDTPPETPSISSSEKSNSTRTLWIRVHPSALESATVSIKTARERISALQQVEVSDLSDDINTFELIGPRTSQVIHGALKPVGGDREFNQFWKSLGGARSPGSFSTGIVVGLTVHDPRLNFPPTNTKVDDDTFFSETEFAAPNARLAQSELWEQDVRDKLRTPSFKKGDLDKRRSQNITPGSRLRPTSKDDKIPIMLIQHSISSNRARTEADGTPEPLHGWTLMLPPSWSMAFLTSLVYTGTRAVGLAARHHQRLESRSPHFPNDYVGSPVYLHLVTQRAVEEQARWERTPKSKRINFDALGIPQPWLSDWDGLISGSSPDVTMLDLLPTDHTARLPTKKPWIFSSDVGQLAQDVSPSSNDSQVFGERLNACRARRELPALDGDLTHELFDTALIHVHVDMLGRGNPQDRAVIYGCDSDEEFERWMTATQHQATRNPETLQCLIIPGQAPPVLGYITSGNYSLQLGHGHGIGAITLKGFINMARKCLDKTKIPVRVRNLNGPIAQLALMTLI